jgi:hypothetical protein
LDFENINLSRWKSAIAVVKQKIFYLIFLVLFLFFLFRFWMKWKMYYLYNGHTPVYEWFFLFLNSFPNNWKKKNWWKIGNILNSNDFNYSLIKSPLCFQVLFIFGSVYKTSSTRITPTSYSQNISNTICCLVVTSKGIILRISQQFS